jgi:cytochrome c oxidase subunit 4
MDNPQAATAISGHAEPSFSTRTIWRTFWILLFITLAELALAILYYETDFMPKHFVNGIFLVGTLAKAFFIIAEFMHLRHEIRNLIMSISVPALLFIWFLGAFLWDGNSYKNLRNRYDRYHAAQSKTPVKETNQKHQPEAKKPGTIE